MSACAVCEGVGKYSVRKSDLGWKDIGNGYQIGGGGSICSELCECRRNLPPRDGEASWWASEVETIAEISFAFFDEQAVVSLRPEVPVSEDNYIVHRRGNRYYPTSVQLHVTSAELNWLFPDEARALGEALIRAAARVEEIDGVDASIETTATNWPSGAGDGNT